MANKISTEVLIMIINNVQSTQDLHSSSLVNRIWCKVTIPKLWELALGLEYSCDDDEKMRKNALCVRTYISCMGTQARSSLRFDLSSSPPQATFDYPSFTRKFIINNLVYFISIYSQQINSQKIIGVNKNNKNRNEISIGKSRILFREIFKLIMERCNSINSFKITSVLENFSDDFVKSRDLFGSILKLSGVPKVFKELESFTSIIENQELIFPLYKSLKLISDNILNMDLFLFSYSQVQLLAELICAQNRLENLSIGAKYFLDYNSIFWAIISQKETLKSLRFKSISFYDFRGESSQIGQFTSLQELYMESCSGLFSSVCLSLASSFTQLNSFHYFHSDRLLSIYPQQFIQKIFETANTKLRKICLNKCIPYAFSDLLNYCTNIIELTLHNLTLEQVIAIFNNNFNELRRFSFDCVESFDDADELLCQMAENVPESLETIEIKMGLFSADSLRIFFEGWCCKEGGRNKKMVVKRQMHLFTLSDDHLKVIEEYGVQFDIEE